MIVLVGKKIRLGHFITTIKERLGDDIKIIEESISIKAQENDILAVKDAKYVIYDIEQYLDSADEIVSIITKIRRVNRAYPILVVPTIHEANELVKRAMESGIRLFIKNTESIGEQKNELEQIILGVREVLEREDVKKLEEHLQKEEKKLNDFVEELYEAKEREIKKDKTVIIHKKKASEIFLYYLIGFSRLILTLMSMVLSFVAIIVLIYPDTRNLFFTRLDEIITNIFNLLS